uniref:F-BAR domain-containing protein n=1 Tax=Chromera velia CCMP2878 TaxID=1169474 RepID=A0A0G4GU26_9ALVE|eukprot:Cvel_23351.t1-p1 / transcript=Cvel_23351.t1 / gene=Cvel_23351 / organism=Chromera_velia_CCMP2878 / gene_product=Mental retardation GTPase activating protein, putative / transcript_product=Mental retardation GTPase activating protein, putative / location=Cvel_scaffold2395:12372-16616(+) / protein_length=1055 / sequence_SO=supercontig / SO=protein_coding / is_pseudo=false
MDPKAAQADAAAKEEEDLEARYKEVSFQSDLFDGFETICKKVENGRKLCEQLTGLLKDLAQVEEYNATSNERLAQKWLSTSTTVTEGTTVCKAVGAIRMNLLKSAEQSRTFADSIKEDLLQQLTGTVKNHASVLKKIYADGQRFNQHLTVVTAAHDRAITRYAKACRDAQIACEAAQSPAAVRLSSAARREVAQRALHTCKEAQVAEDAYAHAVSVYNKCQQSHAKQMEVILAALQDMEAKRLHCFRDALRKLMIYRTSLVRNAQYDLNDTIAAAETVDHRKEIIQFVQHTKTGATRPKPKEVLTYTQILAAEAQQQTTAAPPRSPTTPAELAKGLLGSSSSNVNASGAEKEKEDGAGDLNGEGGASSSSSSSTAPPSEMAPAARTSSPSPPPPPPPASSTSPEASGGAKEKESLFSFRAPLAVFGKMGGARGSGDAAASAGGGGEAGGQTEGGQQVQQQQQLQQQQQQQGGPASSSISWASAVTNSIGSTQNVADGLRFLGSRTAKLAEGLASRVGAVAAAGGEGLGVRVSGAGVPGMVPSVSGVSPPAGSDPLSDVALQMDAEREMRRLEARFEGLLSSVWQDKGIRPLEPVHTAQLKAESEKEKREGGCESEAEAEAAAERAFINRPFDVSEFEDSAARAAFCIALNKKRLAKETALPSRASLKEVALLCSQLLEACNRDFDVSAARQVVFLAQAFHVGTPPSTSATGASPSSSSSPESRGEGEKEGGASGKSPQGDGETGTAEAPLFLHALLYNQNIWNIVQFWEEALMQAISEDFLRQTMAQQWRCLSETEAEGAERKFRERNPCASSLMNFAHGMALFGVRKEDVRQLVKKVCSQLELGHEFAERLLVCLDTNDDAAAASASPPPSASGNGATAAAAAAGGAQGPLARPPPPPQSVSPSAPTPTQQSATGGVQDFTGSPSPVNSPGDPMGGLSSSVTDVGGEGGEGTDSVTAAVAELQCAPSTADATAAFPAPQDPLPPPASLSLSPRMEAALPVSSLFPGGEDGRSPGGKKGTPPGGGSKEEGVGAASLSDLVDEAAYSDQVDKAGRD